MAHGQPSLPLKPGVIRKKRELGGMTLRQLAERCAEAGQSVSYSQLSKIERDVSRPRPPLLVALASALKLDVEDFVETGTP